MDSAGVSSFRWTDEETEAQLFAFLALPASDTSCPVSLWQWWGVVGLRKGGEDKEANSPPLYVWAN